jgi:non-homologous end joining protein Ku
MHEISQGRAEEFDTKAADFDPSTFEDHYETTLVELLKKKQAGFKPPKGKEAWPRRATSST